MGKRLFRPAEGTFGRTVAVERNGIIDKNNTHGAFIEPTLPNSKGLRSCKMLFFIQLLENRFT